MAENDTPKKTSRTTPSRAASTRKTSARKPTAGGRRPAARAPRSTPPIDDVEHDLDEADSSAQDDLASADEPSYRPVAVMGAVTGAPERDALDLDDPGEVPGEGATDAPAAAAVAAPDEIEHPMRETGVGALAALLAFLTFVPWYRSGPIEASGWSSGTWGPVVFGLALAAVLIVVLRRVGVPLVLPLHHAVIFEGIGWAAVGLVLLKRFMAPTVLGGPMDDTGWLLVAILVALALALVGGTVTSAASVVIRPGWLSSSAGKLGAGVLGGSLLLGAVFGVLNDVSTGQSGLAGQSPQVNYTQGYPDCARNAGVPLPDGVTPGTGTVSEDTGFCVAQMTSQIGALKLLQTYARSLKTTGWTIVYDSRKDKASAQLLGQLQAEKGDTCASVTITKNPQGEGRSVIALVGPPATVCSLKEKIESGG